MGCNIFLPSSPMNKIFIPNEALEFCDTAAFLDPQISQTLSSACKLTEDGASMQDICFFAATLRDMLSYLKLASHVETATAASSLISPHTCAQYHY